MGIIAPVPIIINSDGGNDEIDIAICQALPTKAETLVCLEKVKHDNYVSNICIFGGLLVAFILLAVFFFKL